nr:MAG: capsid protein [Emberiza pusilla parvo-like hybrid virus]
MNRQHRRNLAYALGFNVANPFAQLTRLSQGPNQVRHRTIRSQSDLPQDWQRMPNLRNSNAGPAVIPNDDEMDDSEDMSTAVALSRAMGSAGGSGKKGNQETPITRMPSHFGIRETDTVVLPSTTYFSVSANWSNPSRFDVRLTSIVDKQITSVGTPAANAAYALGFWNAVMPTNLLDNWPAVPIAFPSNATDGLQWRTWYTKMYNYYHVMGVEWELTVQNASATPSGGIAVVNYIDTFSANNATQVHPTTATISQMEQWPDTTVTYIDSTGDSTNDGVSRTIRGYYYPQKVRQNVENDEDVDTWTATSATPALTEQMAFKFFPAWNATTYVRANCRLKMRFIVQFKDLAPVYRWPAGQTAIALNAPADILL